MTKVLYPGSFDPITKGHMNIVNQTCDLFDEIVIAILKNPNKKNYFFTSEERLEMIKEIYKDNPNVKVVLSDKKAAVDVALENNCNGIIRGLRSVTDFEYEIGLSQINKEISNDLVNTICLFADSNYQFISSSVVRELVFLDKDVSRYVDDVVLEKIEEKKKVLTNGT